MKKIVVLLLTVCMLMTLVPVVSNAAGSQSSAPDAYKALHALTDEQQNRAQYLIEHAVDLVPEVSNEPVVAEHEDSGITLWFDHSYYNTPAEEITSNGRNTYQIALAKNETEGCHLLIASDKDMSGLTLKVSNFKNADGKKLDKEICYGWYFEDVDGKTVADPIPVLEHEFELKAGKSQMFIIKVKTKDTTPAGQYTATVKLKDSDGNVIKQANVYAYVWDFTLPVASYCKTLTDLNEWSVIVGANREDTTRDGLEDDLYSLYYEYLLDNKVNCYTLPYAKRGQFWDDRVEQYMDDPRCTAFTLFWKHHPESLVNGKYLDAYLDAAYQRVSKKQEWLDKAYFYPDKGDEPLSTAALNNIKTWNAQFTQYFGEHKLIIPIHYNTNVNSTADYFKYLENDVNVWCPKTYFFNTSADKAAYSALYNQYYSKTMENKYGVFTERMAQQKAEGDEVWWYVTRFPHNPEITFSINDESVKHRLLFWQSKLYDIDGVLYYMCNDWENAKQWTKKYEHIVSGTVVDTYGNGVLIYPGGALQEYIDKYGSDGYPGPIGSLRLESIRDGVEDYDYFTLLDEKYGEGTSDLMIKQMTTALGDYSTDTERFAAVRKTVGNLLAGDIAEEQNVQNDVTGDRTVDNKDVEALFRFVDDIRIEVKNEDECDVNKDGEVDNKDVVVLFRYISGKTDTENLVVNGSDKIEDSKLNIVIDGGIEPKTVNAGDEVDVRIELKNNTRISSLKIDLIYDEKLSVVTSETADKPKVNLDIYDNEDASVIYSVNLDAENHTLILNWLSCDCEVSGDTTFATVTFKTPDDAAPGSFFPVTASINSNNVFNYDRENSNEAVNVDFNLINGGVGIIEHIPGDIKCDEFSHWHECVTCGEILDIEPHKDDDNDGVCDVCGYVLKIRGDVNGDGAINNKDVVMLFRYVSDNSGIIDPFVYDFNGDGAINNKDVVALFRAVSVYSI